MIYHLLKSPDKDAAYATITFEAMVKMCVNLTDRMILYMAGLVKKGSSSSLWPHWR